jgi:hypothetical protein
MREISSSGAAVTLTDADIDGGAIDVIIANQIEIRHIGGTKSDLSLIVSPSADEPLLN